MNAKRNCCKIDLNWYNQDISFRCDASCKDECSFQGDWAPYYGGYCSHMTKGASCGCWCRNTVAQADAIVSFKTRLGNMLEKMSTNRFVRFVRPMLSEEIAKVGSEETVLVDSSAICARVHELTALLNIEEKSPLVQDLYHRLFDDNDKTICYGDKVKMRVAELVQLFGTVAGIPTGIVFTDAKEK